MPEPILELRDLAKSYGAVEALRGVSLDVAEGSFVALVGASGSGKSTLLKTVNALIVPGTGSVSFEGEDVAALPGPALRRRIGYVFQAIGLFPHMSVGENVGIGLKLAGERNRFQLGQFRLHLAAHLRFKLAERLVMLHLQSPGQCSLGS